MVLLYNIQNASLVLWNVAYLPEHNVEESHNECSEEQNMTSTKKFADKINYNYYKVLWTGYNIVN